MNMAVLAACLGIFLVSYVIALPRYEIHPSSRDLGDAAGYEVDTLPWEESHPYDSRDDLPLLYYGGQLEAARGGRFRRDLGWGFPLFGGDYNSWAERGRSIGDYFRALRERRRNYWRNFRS
ncbi:hypothetical protein J437_LFUL010545 [Ladona fulva]|uniref:Uncharacterized protein n=1 Tax=Ladona fulva TaxID=123851 RepID=A0A8K0P200_LADFU|nr:hypothetical protein J437_LFUL010545 [Ladona fulva]